MSFIVKNTTFPGLCDLICPHSCRGCGATGEVLCECCKKDLKLNWENYCPNCKQPVSGGYCRECELPPTFMVGWRDELLGRLVHDFKYNSVRALGKELAELFDYVLPNVAGKVLVVPLPTIAKHVRARGLDHTLILGKELARRRKWKVGKVLTRLRNTVQVGADEKTRLKQADEAYELVGGIDSGATYVLIDDVWTTGASMRAAIKKLQGAGASRIIIAVLAVNRIGKKLAS